MNGLDTQPRNVRVLRPFATYLDWLTLNVTAPVALWSITETRPWRFSGQHHDERALWLQPTEGGTAHFARKFYLVDAAGTKLVTFTACPHSLALHRPDDAQVQFANCTLYGDWWWDLWSMLRRAGFVYKSVSRMDIAADGIAGNGGDFQDVVQGALFGGEGRYYGKAKWQPQFFRSKVEGFTLGTGASDKWLRCYNKSKELKRSGHDKPHIRQAWQARLGFDPISDGVTVNRFEIRVKGKELRDYFPRELSGGILEDVRNADMRGDVVRSLSASLFDFRTFAVRARDAEPLALWDWSECTRSGNDLFERKPKKLTLSAYAVKNTLRTLYLLHLASGDRDTLQECMKIAHASGSAMVEWWDRARKRWAKVHANLRQRSAEGLDVGLWDQFTID